MLPTKHHLQAWWNISIQIYLTFKPSYASNLLIINHGDIYLSSKEDQNYTHIHSSTRSYKDDPKTPSENASTRLSYF